MMHKTNLSKKYKMRLICKYSIFKYTWTSMLFKSDFYQEYNFVKSIQSNNNILYSRELEGINHMHTNHMHTQYMYMYIYMHPCCNNVAVSFFLSDDIGWGIL